MRDIAKKEQISLLNFLTSGKIWIKIVEKVKNWEITMASIRIVTDSNSGITQKEAEKLGISVLPMPFLIDGEEFYEDINLTQQEFYEHLKAEASDSTSQPSTVNVTELWDSLLKEYDEIVHIPMSSGLSESCHTAERLAESYGGRVQVVDNQRISITQKQSVYDALALEKQGKSAAEIKEILLRTKFDSSIYISEGSPLPPRSWGRCFASSPSCRSKGRSSTPSRKSTPSNRRKR